MPRNLSEITPEIAEYTLQHSRTLLDAYLADTPPTDVQQASTRAMRIASLRLELAVAAYVLERPEREIVSELRAAAEARAAQWAPVARGEADDCEVWSLVLLDLGLISAFGSERARSQCARLPAEAVVLTDDGELIGRAVALAWLSVVRGEQPELDSSIERAATLEDPWLHDWVHGIARGLRALLRRDEAELAGGLALIAKFSRRESLHGDWQRSANGPISMPALGLCRLALERGIALQSDSPYVPTALLAVP